MRLLLAYSLAGAWFVCVCALTVKHWPSAALPTGGAAEAVSFSALGFIERAGSHLFGLAQLGFLFLVLLGAGDGFVRLVGIGKAPASRLILRLLCGFGALSLLHHGMGLSGLLCRPLIAALLTLFAALAAPYLARERPWRAWNLSLSLPVVLTSVLFLCAFLLARLPDTHWDPAVYHFAAPEHYLLLGKIDAEPQHVYWHNPLGAEMIFLPAWALGGITFAKLVNVCFLLAGTLALTRLARLLSSSAATGAWAAVWYLSAGLILDLVWQGKNDIAAATYLLAAAWCACRSLSGGRGWLLAAGWFLGLGLSVKYTAWLPAAGLAAVFFWFHRPLFLARSWIAAGAACAVPVAGWLAANLLFLGNPLHPFLGSFFPDIGWSDFLHKSYFAMDNALRPPESFSIFDPAGSGLWRAFGESIHGSLGLFTLLPAALLLARGNLALLLKFTVLAACLLWLPTHRNPRYLFPVIPLVSLLAAAAMARLGRPERAAAAVLAIVTVAVSLTHSIPRLAGWTGIQYLAGGLTEGAFLQARYTTWESFRNWVNDNLPASARIDLSGDERRLGFKPRVRSYSAVVQPTFWRLTRDSFSVKEVAKRVRQLGLTHLAHNFVTGEFRGVIYFPGPAWSKRQLKLYVEVARRHFMPLFLPNRADRANGGFYLFAFTPEPEPDGFPLFLLPFTEGHFREAWMAHSARRTDEAFKKARAAAEPMRDTFQAQLVLASLRYRAGDYASAHELLRPGVAAGFVGSWDGWNVSLCGTAAINIGLYDEGIALMEKSYAVTGEAEHLNIVGMGLIGRGQEKQKKGDVAGALDDFRRAVPLLTDSNIRSRLEQKVRYLGLRP